MKKFLNILHIFISFLYMFARDIKGNSIYLHLNQDASLLTIFEGLTVE